MTDKEKIAMLESTIGRVKELAADPKYPHRGLAFALRSLLSPHDAPLAVVRGFAWDLGAVEFVWRDGGLTIHHVLENTNHWDESHDQLPVTVTVMGGGHE